MVVEHAFITTLEEDAAFARVEQMLTGAGFKLVPNEVDCTKCGYSRAGLAVGSCCPECGQADTSAHRRRFERGGKINSLNWEVITSHPQRVFLDFDRGRIGLAASIEEPRMKGTERHRALLLGLAGSVESLLAQQAGVEASIAAFRAVHDKVTRECTRARTIKWCIGGGIILLLVGTCAGLAIFAK